MHAPALLGKIHAYSLTYPIIAVGYPYTTSRQVPLRAAYEFQSRATLELSGHHLIPPASEPKRLDDYTAYHGSMGLGFSNAIE